MRYLVYVSCFVHCHCLDCFLILLKDLLRMDLSWNNLVFRNHKVLTQSEVDHERLGWNNVAEGAKFTHFWSSSPNTEEMDALFFIIKNAIDNNLTLFIYIQGECVLYISFSLHVILTLIVVQVKPVLEKQLLPRSCVHMFDRAAKLRWVALPPR